MIEPHVTGTRRWPESVEAQVINDVAGVIGLDDKRLATIDLPDFFAERTPRDWVI